MNMRRILTLSSLLLLAALTVNAQTTPYDLEIGYRFFDVKGNEDMYRTQINERSGLLIRNFTLSTVDFNGHTAWMDHFRIDVSDFGAGPASSLRIETGRSNSYRIFLNYRRTDAFSALPTYANPFLAEGVVPGQHTYNRTRDVVDADVEFLLGGKISPFVGYTFNRYAGPGRTTMSFGGDEFQLTDSRNDRDNELRAGASFTVSRFTGMVTQGWRSMRRRQTLNLLSGAGAGNNPGNVVGRPTNATTIISNLHDDVKTPFTNAFVTGQLTNRVKLIGNFVYFSATNDGTDNSTATGSFVSFPISRFFAGLTEDISTSAKNKTWRGGARTEINLREGIDLLAGYQREQRDLTGSGLFNTIFQQTVTFGGGDPRDITTVLNANNRLRRTEDVANVGLAARALGPFAVRLGVSRSNQKIDITPDLSEIVVPGASQGGEHTRAVNTFDGNVTYGIRGLILGAAYRKDKADDPILRTDFVDRDRVRVRAAYAAPRWVRVGVSAEQTNQSNDQTGINYDAKIRQYSGDVEVTPWTPLRLRVAASQYKADTSMLFRRPENFQLDTSIHTENGKSLEGGIGVNIKALTLDADAARFDNKGSTPFNVDRYRARASYDFAARFGIGVEWAKDRYTEDFLGFGDYDANRYGVFLRLHP